MEKIISEYVSKANEIDTYNYTVRIQEMKMLINEIVNDERLESIDKKFIYDFCIYPILKERNLIKDFEEFSKKLLTN